MIRNVVIHMNNEQPLVADLFEMPDSGDGLLRCTNLRTLGGKRPVFADEMASTFYFPYLNIRFLEFTPRTLGGPDQPATTDVIAVSAANGTAPADDEAGGDAPGEAVETELEIDEDFLRRIREA